MITNLPWKPGLLAFAAGAVVATLASGPWIGCTPAVGCPGCACGERTGGPDGGCPAGPSDGCCDLEPGILADPVIIPIVPGEGEVELLRASAPEPFPFLLFRPPAD